MGNGANSAHKQLRTELENYIKSQYFGKSPILLSALSPHLDDVGLLYQKPYIESSPAYKNEPDGINKTNLPQWLKEFFGKLCDANLGVYSVRLFIRLNHLYLHITERICLYQQVPVQVKQNVSCGICSQNL